MHISRGGLLLSLNARSALRPVVRPKGRRRESFRILEVRFVCCSPRVTRGNRLRHLIALDDDGVPVDHRCRRMEALVLPGDGEVAGRATLCHETAVYMIEGQADRVPLHLVGGVNRT